ncbi:MAG: MFS transporter [Halobacteriota archaeon]|nr:MFS transporter [Halobacteriota archaeon]
MRFGPKDTLTEEEVESGLKSVIRDGLTTQTMLTFTGGAFLVAFALKLGASNSVIGLIAAIPPLAQLIQIPSVYLIEKIRNRRKIAVYASLIGRMFWLLVALIPLLFSIEAGLSFLIIALALNSIFAGIGGCSWNSWMRDLIPQDRLGSFFSRRMTLTTAIGIPLSLASAVYIDYWKVTYPENELQGYSILFFLGFLAGMLGVYFVSTIPEPRMQPSESNFLKLISQPFKDTNFKNLIMFMGSWNFAVNLAAPFFTVYMLKRLQFDLSIIIAFTILSQLTSLAFLRLWGRFTDRFSNKSVLGVCGPLFMLTILAWTFTTMPGRYVLTMPLLILIHIFMGISTSGVTLASGNIGLKLAPKGQATSYLASNSLINSIMAGIAPILGGRLADFFAERELEWTLRYTAPSGDWTIPTLSLQQWDFFFLFAFLIGLYSIHRLAMVKEDGEVEENVVVQELISEMRRMRNFSTVGGLRQMVQYPFSIIRTSYDEESNEGP